MAQRYGENYVAMANTAPHLCETVRGALGPELPPVPSAGGIARRHSWYHVYAPRARKYTHDVLSTVECII